MLYLPTQFKNTGVILFLLTLLLAGSCADPKYNDFATIFSNTLRNDSTLLVNNIPFSIYNKEVFRRSTCIQVLKEKLFMVVYFVLAETNIVYLLYLTETIRLNSRN